MPVSSQDAVGYFQASGFRFLPIEVEHTLAVENLPPHHHDPFDRLLIAQAQIEPMHLLTQDALVTLYGDLIIRI